MLGLQPIPLSVSISLTAHLTAHCTILTPRACSIHALWWFYCVFFTVHQHLCTVPMQSHISLMWFVLSIMDCAITPSVWVLLTVVVMYLSLMCQVGCNPDICNSPCLSYGPSPCSDLLPINSPWAVTRRNTVYKFSLKLRKPQFAQNIFIWSVYQFGL